MTNKLYYANKQGSTIDIITDEVISSMFKFIVITELDSSREVGKTAAYLERNFVSAKKFHIIEKKYCVISTSQVLNFIDIFNGFDEVALFKHKPTIKSTIDISLTGTSQEDLLDLIKNNTFVEFFESNQCSLIIGDGLGVSFITDELLIYNIIIDALNNIS